MDTNLLQGASWADSPKPKSKTGYLDFRESEVALGSILHPSLRIHAYSLSSFSSTNGNKPNVITQI